MKQKYLSILLIFISTLAIAQKQRVNYLTTFDDKLIHFGFTLGFNTLDFGIANYSPIGNNPDFVPRDWQLDKEQVDYFTDIQSDVATLIPGFTVGIISSLRLSRDFNLRFLPGLSFGERQITYNVDVWDIYKNEPSTYYSIKSTFLDFPLLLKYKARRINNDRPYLIFGGAYRQDISRSAQEDLVSLKRGSFYAELGAGWDHYFTFFRFSVEAKISLGLNDILGNPPGPTQRQYYTHSIKELRSNIFTVLFHFE